MFFYIPRNHEKILLKNLPLHHFNRANPELVSCHGKVRPTWQIVLRQCHKPANCHPFFCSYLKLPTDKYPCLWLIKASDICTVTSYWHDLYTNDAQLMLSVIRWSEEAPNWLSEVSISNTGKKKLPSSKTFSSSLIVICQAYVGLGYTLFLGNFQSNHKDKERKWAYWWTWEMKKKPNMQSNLYILRGMKGYDWDGSKTKEGTSWTRLKDSLRNGE